MRQRALLTALTDRGCGYELEKQQWHSRAIVAYDLAFRPGGTVKLKIVGALKAFVASAQKTFPDKPPKPGAIVIKARGIKVEG